MNHSDARSVIWQTFSIAATLVATLGTSPRGASAQDAAVQGQTATNPTRYQVNYRASESDPWQLYASTRSLEKANTIAAEVKKLGLPERGGEQFDSGTASLTPIMQRPAHRGTIRHRTGRRTTTTTCCRGETITTAGMAGGIRRTAIDLIPTIGGTAGGLITARVGAGITGAVAGGAVGAGVRGWSGGAVERQSPELE